MRISVCAKSCGELSEVDERFGRCEYFVIFDTLINQFETIVNSAKEDASGAGSKAVAILSENGVDCAIVPELGPKAITAFEAFEIEAYKISNQKTVQEALDDFKSGIIKKMPKSSESSHSGLRRV